MGYYPKWNAQYHDLQVYKDIEVKSKFSVDNEYELKVKIDKYKDVDVDVDVDVDIDGNEALGTGVFENIGSYTLVGDVSTYTDEYYSKSTGFADVVDSYTNGSPFLKTGVTVNADAYGDNTFTEIDITAEAYEYGSLVTVISESATD